MTVNELQRIDYTELSCKTIRQSVGKISKIIYNYWTI